MPAATGIARSAAAIALLLAACCTVIGIPPAWATASRMAGAPASQATLALGQVSPTVASPGKPVTLTGTITFPGSIPAGAVLSAAVGTRDLDTTTSVQSWMSGSSDLSTRTRVSGRLGDSLSGIPTPFRLTIPASALTVGYSNANLPVLLTLSDSSGAQVRAWRTTISLVSGRPAATISVTWVVPLTLPPDPNLFAPTGATRTAAWVKAIGPGSRIDTLLTTLADQPVTWVIDPAIVMPSTGPDANVPAVTTTTPPNATATPTSTSSDSPTGTDSSSTGSDRTSSTGTGGTSVPTSTAPTTTAPPTSSSTGSASPSSTTTSTSSPSSPSTGGTTATTAVDGLAQKLQQRLTHLPRQQSVLWTAFDDPDVSSLITSGARGRQLLSQDVHRGLPSDLAAVSTHSVIWPAAAVSPASVRTIEATFRAEKRFLPLAVLPERAIQGGTGLTSNALRRASGTAGLLLYDEQLSTLLGESTGDAGLRAQNFLADTLAIHQESPATPRSVAVVVPRTGGATPAQLRAIMLTARAAPWLSDRTAADLLPTLTTASTATLQSSAGVTFPATGTPAIGRSLLAQVARQRNELGGVNALLVASPDVIVDRLRLVDQVGSTRWRGDPQGANLAAAYSERGLRSLLSLVTIKTSPVNFFTDRGELSITVVNGLGRAVHNVYVVLAPRSNLLKVTHQAGPLSLDAGGRGIAQPRVAAVAGSGEVPVDAFVLTYVQHTNTGVPLGAPPTKEANLQVNVRPTATWIYWVLGAVAAVILLAGLVRQIRKERRNQIAGGERIDATAPGSVGESRGAAARPGGNDAGSPHVGSARADGAHEPQKDIDD